MTLKEWLESTGGITNVENVKVTLGKRQFDGCRYIDPNRREEGTGKIRIYIPGVQPQLRRVASCYTCDGEDWYVACFLSQEAYDKMVATFAPDNAKAQAEYHPFGPSFVLSQWTAPGKIDEYERYDRIPMVVEVVEENHV